jgi:iron complex outermembrane receptor protein
MGSAPATAQAPDEPRGGEEAEPPGPDAPAREAPPPAPAAPPSDIEVLVIKGQQHENLLQDTSISGTSFDAKQLDDLRIQNISDLADFTPNLDINTRSAASNPTLFIRGIGLKDYNANAAGAVAIYQDGININSPAIQLGQLFDVESIEVLRGPQGAGSGHNATAGAIRIKSVEPDGQLGATASFTYGNYNTLQGEGALSVPLVGEMLSARFAFTANFRDGITDNECAGWDPEAHGFRKVTQGTIEETYAALLANKDERVEVFFGPGAQQNPPRGPRGPRWIYGAAEDVLRESGVQIGRRVDNGQLVGIQGDTFTDNRVDNMCILDAPGRVVTPQGIDPLNAQGLPRDPFAPELLDQFLRTNVPALEDFQGLKTRVNNVDDWAGRGILRFQPFEGMDWLLNAHGGRNRSDSSHLQSIGADSLVEGGYVEAQEDGFSEASAAAATGLEGLRVVNGLLTSIGREPGAKTGADPFSGWYNLDGTEFLDSWGVSLRGQWDLGPAILRSTGGYEWYDRLVEDEGDANPADVFPADYSDSAWQISEELRAEGEGERHGWNVGLFFLHEKLSALNLFPDTQQFRIEQEFAQTLWSFAPYVGGRYDFTEELSLDGGLRYNYERKDFTLASTSVGTTSGASNPEIEEEQVKDTWTGVTGELTLAYKPYWDVLNLIQNDSLTLYGKYGRGMKGGHFNAGLTIRGGQAEARVDPVEPEFIHAVEIGWKSGWLDDRLMLNVAGFRYWYTDLQVFEIENAIGELPLQKLLNSDARVLGAEVELVARPLPGLSIQAGFGWLDASFREFTVTKTVLGPRGAPDPATFDYDGNPLISAPAYSLSGNVEYEIPLSRWGSLVPQYSFSYRSKVYFDPQHLDPISQPAYWLHNARLAYRTADGRIEVAGWVENFMNEFYRDDVFDLTREFNTILEVWGDPRTYGLTVTFSF